jgi:hypothetical protein
MVFIIGAPDSDTEFIYQVYLIRLMSTFMIKDVINAIF